MQHSHFVGTVAQKAIIERDGKILLCRGKGDTLWELPGGRLDEDETPQNGLARELKEELDVDVTVENPVYITRSYHMRDKQYQMFIVYACTISEDQTITPDQREIEAIQWVEKEKLSSVEMFEDCAEALSVYTSK